MAYSIQRAVSDGTLNLLDLSINYIERAEISVYFDSTLQAPGTTWAWVGSVDKKISFTPNVPNGVEVLVKRTTDLSDLRHRYSAGAAFTAGSVDESLEQVLHIAQEATEVQLGAGFYNDIDMHTYQIKNLGDAVDARDAVPFAQYLADASGASAAKDTAVASASTAVASSNSASASASAALLSANNADVSEANALSSANSASTSANTASTKAAEAAASAAAALASANAAALADSNAGASEVAAAASAAAALHPWEAEAGGIHYDLGSVRIGGSGKRIKGDFSNATLANRMMFQTSTVNSTSSVGIIPNGTGSQAQWDLYTDSAVINGNFAGLKLNNSEFAIRTQPIGTGTATPMTFYTGGSERMRIDTAGQIGLSGANYGTTGQVIVSGGPSAAPSWGTVSGVPTGTVIFTASSSAPTGFLKANGALVSRTTYAGLFSVIGTTFGVGDGSTTFALPDLRGEFIRGWDDARGVDSGRAIGSWQNSDNKSHTHNFRGGNAVNGGTIYNAQYGGGGSGYTIEATGSIVSAGGGEARPRNIALLACIKF